MAIEGPLRELALQEVLQLLELAHKTGVLVVDAGFREDEAEIHVEGGRIVYARWLGSPRRLGQQLLRAGKLTERELTRALEVQRRHPREPLGRILLEQGSVERSDLERHLQFQIEEAVHEILGWREGTFRFEERDTVGVGPPEVRVRVESVLMEGARRSDEWARLASGVSSADAVPVLTPPADAGAPLELRPEDWEVLAEVDGERDLREIAAALGRSSFDIARIASGLVGAGILRVGERPVRHGEQELGSALAEAARRLEAGDAESAARLAAELGAASPDRVEPVLLEGRALARQGRARAATEAFARAVAIDPLARDAHYHLGFAAARIGEFDRAVEAFETYLRLSAEDGAADPAATRALSAVRALAQILAEGATTQG